VFRKAQPGPGRCKYAFVHRLSQLGTHQALTLLLASRFRMLITPSLRFFSPSQACPLCLILCISQSVYTHKAVFQAPVHLKRLKSANLTPTNDQRPSLPPRCSMIRTHVRDPNCMPFWGGVAILGARSSLTADPRHDILRSGLAWLARRSGNSPTFVIAPRLHVGWTCSRAHHHQTAAASPPRTLSTLSHIGVRVTARSTGVVVPTLPYGDEETGNTKHKTQNTKVAWTTRRDDAGLVLVPYPRFILVPSFQG
jgi:hypothetical protein